MLINLLMGFSRDIAAIRRVTFGGDELDGWELPAAAGAGEPSMPPKVRQIVPLEGGAGPSSSRPARAGWAPLKRH